AQTRASTSSTGPARCSAASMASTSRPPSCATDSPRTLAKMRILTCSRSRSCASWKAEPASTPVALGRGVINRSGGGMRRTWAGAVVGTMLFAAGCATNPVTGRTELALISESQEIAMGQEAAAQVEASIGVVDDADLNAYVQRVGESLARISE